MDVTIVVRPAVPVEVEVVVPAVVPVPAFRVLQAQHQHLRSEFFFFS